MEKQVLPIMSVLYNCFFLLEEITQQNQLFYEEFGVLPQPLRALHDNWNQRFLHLKLELERLQGKKDGTEKS